MCVYVPCVCVVRVGCVVCAEMRAECVGESVCAACYKYLADYVIARQAPSNIFMSPGFELGYIALDSMHCGDLGVFQDAVGGLLWLEISNKGFHRSHAQGVTFLNEQLKEPIHISAPST